MINFPISRQKLFLILLPASVSPNYLANDNDTHHHDKTALLHCSPYACLQDRFNQYCNYFRYTLPDKPVLKKDAKVENAEIVKTIRLSDEENLDDLP